jgi:flagellar L-ring protein precursor FlgH
MPVVWLMSLVLAATAGAQSNSLLRRGAPPPPPTSQPAPTELILPAAVGNPRPRSSPLDAPPPPNLTLMKRSLIAVEAPTPRKIQTHDLLTIIVREDKRSSSDANLKSEKSWKIETELAKWFRIKDGQWLQQGFNGGVPATDFELDNEYEGKGKTDRKDTLQMRVTATVVDVKPNGTLTLEARKAIELDEDTQVITLTGVCRSEDVTAQNTVLSTQLADVSVSVTHSGPARDAARRGWLMKAFDFLRPF